MTDTENCKAWWAGKEDAFTTAQCLSCSSGIPDLWAAGNDPKSGQRFLLSVAAFVKYCPSCGRKLR